MSLSRDEQRIEEEIAGVQRPARAASLSGEYLMQAFDAIHAAGDPASLYAHARQFPPRSPADQERATNAARRDRVRFARTAVLLTALAAESYVNEFLAAHGVLDEWDRQPPHRKYLKGTAAAYGEALFFADREGYAELVELFKLRDRLVHPKPGFGVPGVLGIPDEQFAALFDLPKVAEYIVMVGGAADLLVRRAYGFDALDFVGFVAWRGRPVLREFARRQRRLPAWDAPAERPLFRQAGDYVRSMPRFPPEPDEWQARLRATRARQARS